MQSSLLQADQHVEIHGFDVPIPSAPSIVCSSV